MMRHSFRTVPAVFFLLFCGMAYSHSAFATDTESKKTESSSGQTAESCVDESRPEGHSSHGEVFNDGPRQAAYLMEGVGQVHFDVTTDTPEAAQFIVQGIGQLHGFWYFESERSFRQAAFIDPDCAIAYWGMAMSNRRNADRAKGFIREAMDRRNSVSRRELLYIEAFDRYINADAETDEDKERRATRYVEDLESLILAFPDDIEAKAFLCEYLWSGSREGLTLTSYLAVNALIQDILDVEPQHPCHHYRIHLWDNKDAKTALHSAAQCGPAAPSIAHMWHMPGHIYSKLKRYHDAVWQQEASARVDHAHMMKDRVLPDQIHNFAHNNEWCIRNLIHIGRVHDAIDLAKNMIALPRHPKYNDIDKSGSYKYGRQRLLDVLQAFDMHEELIALSKTSWLVDTGDEKADLARDRAMGVAFAVTGRTEDADSMLKKLRQLVEDEKTEQTDSGDKAEAKAIEDKKEDDAVRKARATAERRHRSPLKELQNAIDHIDAHLAAQHKDFDKALELLREAGKGSTEELVALMLDAGQTDDAITKIGEHVRTNKNEVRPLACQVMTLWKAGRTEEATSAFQALRQISSTIDLDVPVFAALAPAARELGFDDDWRIPREQPDDLGSRPELDALGPFRWQPVPAPEWSLPGIDERSVSLSDYRGKPVIVIFYLGYGCLHCAEQLQKFAPEIAKFREAGVEIVAISTDAQDLLRKAQEDLDKELAIPVVADPAMSVFRRYRCYDDFEQQALHGTFIVDADGLVRWQDISYEPFMDVDFVFKETQRLISLPSGSSNQTPASLTAAE